MSRFPSLAASWRTAIQRPGTRLLVWLGILIALAALAGNPDVRWHDHAEPYAELDIDNDTAITFDTRGTARRTDAQGDSLRLRSDPDTPARAWYRFPLGDHLSRHLRVRADIDQLAASQIEHPSTAWWNIRLFDATGDRVHYAALQHFKHGTRWKTDHIVEVPASAVSAQILIHVKPGGAAFTLSSISIAYVDTPLRYTLLIGALLLAAALLLIVALRHVHRQTGTGGVVLALLLAVLIGASVVSPTQLLARHAEAAVHTERLLSHLPALITGGSLLQFGHLLGFLVLALVICASRRRLGLNGYESVLIVLLLAAGSEVVQLHVVGRSMALNDFLRDLGGAAIVFLLCFAYSQISMISGTDTSSINTSSGKPRRQ